mgnify:FL=1
MKRVFLLFFVFFTLLTTQAQSKFVYESLQSAGPVPADFAYYLDKGANEEDGVYKYLVESGLLVYGSPMNKYVEKVADNLLESHYRTLRQELRFYILRRSDVNAYSYANGMIVVTTGLLAQLQNESELAFILAHEIAHYAEKHLEKEKKVKKKDKKYDVGGFLRMVRSREQETEADRIAFERYYQNSKYSYEALDGVFDVLQYSYLPFDEVEFERAFVESEYYTFPDKYFISAVTPIRSREDYVDTLLTHPNLAKRREWIANQVERKSDENRSRFLQSEELFYKLRHQARCETINIDLTFHQYDAALYNTYVLLDENPNDPFLCQAWVAGIYGFAMHKLEGNGNDYITKSDLVEGEQQRLSHFLSKISRDECALLALRFAWNYAKIFPENSYFKQVAGEIIEVLSEKGKMKYQNYSDYAMGIDPSTIPVDTTVKKTETEKKGKYDKIKNQQGNEREKVLPNEDFETKNYMLVDLRADDEFWKLYYDALDEEEDEKLIGEKNAMSERFIVWHPQFYRFRWGKDVPKDKDKVLDDVVELSLKKQDLNASLLIAKDMFVSDEMYNHYCKLQLWSYDFLRMGDAKMFLYQSSGIQPTCDALGTQYLNLLYAVSVPDRISFTSAWFGAIYTISLLPVATPFAVFNSILYYHDVECVFMLYDMVESEPLIMDNYTASTLVPRAEIENAIYRFYHNITPKKGGGK